MKWLVLVAAGCALAGMGCGSGPTILTRDEYARLPRDYRLEIFDAENDVVIAKNREEEARDHKADAEKTLDELEQGWKRTNARLGGSTQAANLPRARHVFDADVSYVETQIDVASAAIRRAEAETELRRARLDLVRQRQAARIGRVTVASIKGYEDRVASLEQRLKVTTAAEVELRTKVQAKLSAWKTAEDEYAAGTSDYDTGVWE